jgi:Tfp pilus assembly protein FimT
MITTSRIARSVLCSTLLLAAFPVLATAQDSSQQSSTDDVAAAARRAREAKQNSAKPRKVITDDDVPQHKETPAATGTGSLATSAKKDNAPGTKKDDAANATQSTAPDSETLWRKRFQDQREKIARAEKELDVLQRESQKAQIQYYPDPQKAMTEEYTRKDINEKDAKIAAKQQEIAQLKQARADLEDDLRKSGGDMGWSRE